jgi:serine phosphatase RsbU (regulator of sigma subunit)
VQISGNHRGAAGGALDSAENASPVDAVESVTRKLGVALGATAASFLISDLSGRALVRLTHVPLAGGSGSAPHAADDERRVGEESATVLPFDGGPVEQAMRAQEVQVEPPSGLQVGGSGLWTVLAPVTERGEAIGLLELLLPAEPDAAAVAEIARTAHLLAFVIIANRRHTDLFEWGRRTRPFTLAAEIQQRLLPGAYTCEAGAFTLAAWLEPAASVAGDTFDYSVDRDVLHLSVTDAMGHGVASAITASICAAGLRGTRRQGASLPDQAVTANAALVEHAARAADEGFVTALLARIDLPTGRLDLVNAGHLLPLLARGASVAPIELVPDLPLGMFAETTYRTTSHTLEPGDRLVIVTDGMLEHGAAHYDLPAGINRTRALHPREMVRVLADDVLDATGHALSDDATVLVLDWHDHHDQERTTTAGADTRRTTRTITQ